MIFDAIVSAVLGAVEWLVGKLPTEPAVPGVSGFVSDMLGLLGNGGVWAGLFPINTIFTALGVVLLWFIANAAIRLLVWVLALLHIAGDGAA